MTHPGILSPRCACVLQLCEEGRMQTVRCKYSDILSAFKTRKFIISLFSSQTQTEELRLYTFQTKVFAVQLMENRTSASSKTTCDDT